MTGHIYEGMHEPSVNAKLAFCVFLCDPGQRVH